MYQTQGIPVKDIELDPSFSTTIQDIAGQLASTSRKTYTTDIKHFARWMVDQDLSLFSLDRDDLVTYRAHLAETYAQSTASRMWAVTRRLLDEAV